MCRNKRTIFKIMVLCLILLAGNATAAERSFDDFEAASKLLTNGKYTEALNLYQLIADQTQHPDTAAQALLLKAIAVGQYLNQPLSALTILDQIQALFPESSVTPDVLFHRGMLYYELQNYKNAAKIFSHYITQYPDGIRRRSAETWYDSATARITPDLSDVGLDMNTFSRNEVIRVLISEGTKQLEIGSPGKIIVKNASTGKILYQSNSPLIITKNQKRLILNGQESDSLKCRIESTKEPLSLKDMRLRGILIVALEPNGIQTINHVPIETYLCGIVSREMPASWFKDALKAQAIASRTYALYVKSKNRFMPFDVEATTESQVYGGYNAETTPTNAAVNATRGQVITRQNRLIIPYFHANSAGHTEAARYVWQVDLPYLKGISDPFSKDLPNSSWQYVLSYAIASQKLNDAGLKVGQIKLIKPHSYTPSGRVFDISLESDSGKLVLSANHFRCLLDAKQIKSTFFKIVPQYSGIILEGNGNGHGVGMSQWGANQMAALGHSYQDILKHYYSGVELSTLPKS